MVVVLNLRTFVLRRGNSLILVLNLRYFHLYYITKSLVMGDCVQHPLAAPRHRSQSQGTVAASLTICGGMFSALQLHPYTVNTSQKLCMAMAMRLSGQRRLLVEVRLVVLVDLLLRAVQLQRTPDSEQTPKLIR